MRALFSTLGLSLAAVLAVVLLVTLVAPSQSVTAAADRDAVQQATPYGGGTIAERVHAAGNRNVVFRYDTWPDVWGDEKGNLNRQNQFHGDFVDVDKLRGNQWRDSGNWTQGPLAVVLTLRHGQVTRLKIGIGESRWHHADNPLDLGKVTAAEAARYLLDLAGTTSLNDLGADAIVAAVFIRDGDIWDGLFRIARDSATPDDIRSSALFWIGQEAGDRAMPELTSVAEDDGDAGIRESAVFALSQRPDSESIPSLTRLARSSRHPEVRRSALFWLAQHDDPKVIDLFEELLMGD